MTTDLWAPPADLLDAVRSARRPLLLTHIYPDGDGVGSCLGLARSLRAMGAEPRILTTHPAPDKFDFIDSSREVAIAGAELSAEHAGWIADADLLLILDTSDPARLGLLEKPVFAADSRRCVIDHHRCSHADHFDAIWSVEESPSTGNLVLVLLETLGANIDAEVATPLFVAICSDTGWFRFANASERAFAAAGRLVDAGADPEEIYSRIFESSSLERTRLLGEVLGEVQGAEDGKVIYGVIRGEMMERLGVSYEEIDGVIDTLKEVRGGEFLFLVVELSKGRYKVSLRSKGSRDVHAIADHFGGGGHVKAAGCRLEGDESGVVEAILEQIRHQLSDVASE